LTKCLLDSSDRSGKAIGDRIGDVKRSIKSAAKRAGLKGVAFYLLRHTCASWLAEQGVASFAIRDILGHSTVKMSDRYLYSHASHLQESVSVLKAIARWTQSRGFYHVLPCVFLGEYRGGMKHVAARLGDGSGRGRFTRQRQRARKGIATTESPLSSTGRNVNRRSACDWDSDQVCGQLGQSGNWL